MRWKSNYKHPKGWCFIIQQEDLYESTGKVAMVEFCLYVYQHTDFFYDDLRDSDCTRFQDRYRQDELSISQEEAFEEFGVPLDSWVEIN